MAMSNGSKAQRFILSNVLPRCHFSSSNPLGNTMLRSAACGVNTSSSPFLFSSLTRPDSCGKSVTYGNFSLTERITVKYVGAAAMYFLSKKLKKRHNITDERHALYDSVETWLNAIDGRDFLGGSKPNLADLAVFGVLRPIRHLKTGKDMVDNTNIGVWFDKMVASVGKSSRSDV